jgi:hypothetical protein
MLAVAAMLPSIHGARPELALAPQPPPAQRATIADAAVGEPGLLLAALPAGKRPKPGAASAASERACKRSVQEFYDWYIPRLMREVRTPALTQALTIRTNRFSRELRRRIAEDSAAAAKSPDEIVGLDFDPFVNSQDPAARYVVKKASRAGKSIRVEVHAVVDGKPSKTPDVIPELVLSGGRWTFVNFHYPAAGDQPKSNLLQVLKELRAGRQKPPRRSGKRL